MHKHSEQRTLPYRVDQLYALVTDIEKYPQFLPWCRIARVLKRTPQVMEAELIIAFKAFSESYVSSIDCIPPDAKNQHAELHVSQLRGPFTHLENHWRFTALPDGKTRLDFSVAFAFRSKILNSLIGLLFEKATKSMVEAFDKRAKALFTSAAQS